jgi:proteasome lid subunit RPN8/RPN11
MFAYQVDDVSQETRGCYAGPLKHWRVPQCPFSIDYSEALLETLGRVVEASLRSPGGEKEAGGVLFGKKGAERIEVLAHRPLECEYAMGPGFVLSRNDEKNLANLKLLCESDPDLAGLEPLGWYHSHVASKIFLSERDLQIHGQYFGAPLQIALVLRPHADRPTRAGFFFRESTGHVQSESSYEEFTIERPRTVREFAAPAPAAEVKSRPAPTVPKPSPEAPLLCPTCGSARIRRSHRVDLLEKLRGFLGSYPYKCEECLTRSFIKRSSDTIRLTRSSRRLRPEEKRRARMRTRREILLWGTGIIGFLLILLYLTRESGPKQDQP